MAEDGLEDVLRPTSLAQKAHAISGMVFGGRMGGVWMALIIEIVHETSQPPPVGILAEAPGVGAHGGLDGEHVLSERLARRVLVDDGKRVGV
jgi:hypothetical protein